MTAVSGVTLGIGLHDMYCQTLLRFENLSLPKAT